jgi:putative RNA 2'-phosphotransferase
MEEKIVKKVGRYLSLILRHKPEDIGLTLDKNGWADVDDLLYLLSKKGKGISMEELEWIVDNNDKKRFAFNSDKTKIRASQGHSIDIDLQLKEIEPPCFLYHGTSTDVIEKIKKDGIVSMSRQYVHLSDSIETAKKVGKRHGNACVLTVDCCWMYQSGLKFYRSENGVYLTNNVPSQYILFEETVF